MSDWIFALAFAAIIVSAIVMVATVLHDNADNDY